MGSELGQYRPYRNSTAAAYAGLINSMDFNTPAIRQSFIDQLIGLGAQVYNHIGTDLRPQICAASNADYAIVALSGTRTIAQGRSLIASYSDRTGRNAGFARKFPSYIQSAADDVYATLVSNLGFGQPTILLCGHSLGGAVATALASLLRGKYPDARIVLCTFGAPKCIGEPVNPFLATIDMVRYVIENDPVQFIPPLPAQAPLIYSALGGPSGRLVSSWGHPCRAVNILRNSETAYPAPLVSGPEVGLTTMLALANSSEGWFGPDHLMQTYNDRLFYNARFHFPYPVPDAVGASGSGSYIPNMPPVSQAALPGVQITPDQLRQADVRMTVFRELASAQESIPVHVPFPNLMQVARFGKTYFVNWMGMDVCTAPTKKKARALARHGNRFLRIYQHVAQSESQTFVMALAFYLTEAANPQGGFRPALRDGNNPPQMIIP